MAAVPPATPSDEDKAMPVLYNTPRLPRGGGPPRQRRGAKAREQCCSGRANSHATQSRRCRMVCGELAANKRRGGTLRRPGHPLYERGPDIGIYNIRAGRVEEVAQRPTAGGGKKLARACVCVTAFRREGRAVACAPGWRTHSWETYCENRARHRRRAACTRHTWISAPLFLRLFAHRTLRYRILGSAFFFI